jgi:hypothetical protein
MRERTLNTGFETGRALDAAKYWVAAAGLRIMSAIKAFHPGTLVKQLMPEKIAGVYLANQRYPATRCRALCRGAIEVPGLSRFGSKHSPTPGTCKHA